MRVSGVRKHETSSPLTATGGEVWGTPTTTTWRPALEKWSQTRSAWTALESATAIEE